jgi:hypothetical protein
MKLLLLCCLLLSCLFCTAQSPEKILADKGITLPDVKKPVANYVHAVRSGNLLFLAGKGPADSTGQYIKGKLGKELSIEQGY